MGSFVRACTADRRGIVSEKALQDGTTDHGVTPGCDWQLKDKPGPARGPVDLRHGRNSYTAMVLSP